jgi:hypothetical protein
MISRLLAKIFIACVVGLLYHLGEQSFAIGVLVYLLLVNTDYTRIKR